MKTGVAYIGVRDPDHVKRDMDALASAGYTHVWHSYSEEDFQFQSCNMMEIIDISVEAGLTVYVSPWGVGKVFSGEALSDLAGQNPEQAQVNNHNKKVVASCINNENFRTYIRKWVEQVCETKAHTVLWDNPKFYREEDEEIWCCRCETCEKLFRKRYRHLMPNSITKNVKGFRTGSIVEFLSEITGLVHTKGKKNSICFSMENETESLEMMNAIGELPTVDELGIKPYWNKGEKPANISKTYHMYSKKLLEVTKEYGKEAQVWIKNYDIAKNNEESVAEATYAAYNEGVRNLFSWAYYGTKCLGKFRSDDPDRVWKIQTEAFGECREKAVMNEMIDTMKALNPD